jgi:negative regulator of sigma E activity
MTCHDAREQFSALVDDALAADGRAALDAHLATCADCRRELQRFRDTVSLVRGVAPVRAPAGFVDRVLEAARPVSWPRRLVRGLFLPWPVKLPMEAAAVVLVAVGVALVYRGTPELELATRLEQPVPVVAQAPESAAPTVATPLPPHPTSLERRVDAPRDQAPAKDQAQALAKREFKEAPEPQKATKPDAPEPARAQQPEGFSSRDAEFRQEVDRRAKLATPPAVAERRTTTSGNVQAPPAPGTLADNYVAQASPPPPAAASSALAPPPDVFGQLAVSDRDAALGKISELIARLGATETRRIDRADGLTLELTIPRDAYAELSRELARLGRWQPTQEPAALPAQVRVVLRITG